MRSQREHTERSAVALYEQAGQGIPQRTGDLAKVAMAFEIGLSMLTAIEPETSRGLYVDVLAALHNQSPFAPTSSTEGDDG